MKATRHPRRIKLINPRLQLKLIGSFVGLSAVSLLVQFLLLSARLSETAASRGRERTPRRAELRIDPRHGLKARVEQRIQCRAPAVTLTAAAAGGPHRPPPALPCGGSGSGSTATGYGSASGLNASWSGGRRTGGR